VTLKLEVTQDHRNWHVHV